MTFEADHHRADEPHVNRRIHVDIRGAVQGVGFRPFVYQRAKELDLAGWVMNTPSGVTLEAEGSPACVATLLRAFEDAPPSNASIASIDIRELAPAGERAFTIRESVSSGARIAQILPDLATCEACLGELFDPADRRHLYPFINCTHCGPRYSIIEDTPYDRIRTVMRLFPMCPACRAEYEDPSNRRFHAEPNACSACGPRAALWDREGATIACDHEAVVAASDAVRRGQIVAVKGLGGVHLIADARNTEAVALLRMRKKRPEKPFAVMFSSLGEIVRECQIAPAETALLTSPARPIVLVRRKSLLIAEGAAPGNPRLGVFLPYTPLHHLLMRELAFPVVATSGNLSDEPIVTDEREALNRLQGVADLFLVHNRPIVRPIDDSVARIVDGRMLMLRRARGYAPAPIAVKGVSPGILALGGHMKSTIALTSEDEVLASQHIGDLETVAARRAHERAVDDMAKLYGVRLRRVVRDLHPDYATSRAAAALGPPVTAVQHHLAHVVACMAENGIAPPVLGVAWDGTGYGTDGTIWGGEFLLITKEGWRRVAHLRPFPLPGGERAVREPRRAALGLLYEGFGETAFAMDDLPPIAALSGSERGVIQTMLARGVNAPRATSMGRLFDAFASLCDLRQRISYEGQAAAEFEWAADGVVAAAPYDFPLRAGAAADTPRNMDWRPALKAALADLRAGETAGAVSAAFHAGLAAAIAAAARQFGEHRVVLSGGCFQNARLTEAAIEALRAAGHEPFWHERLPPNDGGLAVGQAVWAAWTEEGGNLSCV